MPSPARFFPGLSILRLLPVCAAVFQAAWLIFHWGTPAQLGWYANLLYLVVIYLSAALSFKALLTNPAGQRTAAGLLTGALVSLSVAESLWVYFDLFSDQDTTLTLADLFYYPFYALLGLSLLKQVGVRPTLGLLALLLDSVIIVGVVGLYLWWGFLAQGALDSSITLLARTVTLSYPALDLGLLTVLLLALRGQRFTRSSALFAVGLVCHVAADLYYAFLNSSGKYVSGTGLDALWTWGAVALAIGGSFQTYTQAHSKQSGAVPPRWLTLGLTGLPYFAVLASCALLIRSVEQPGAASMGVAWGTVLLFLLVMLRQTVTFRENARLTAELVTFSEQLERSRTLLTHQAFHDVLTALPNRALLQDRLEQALAVRNRQHLAVLCIDLDGFKLVNDSLGHAAGDALLVQAAGRMKRILRDSDTLARMGGDEFTVVLTDMDRPENAEHVASRLLHLFSEPFQIGAERVRVSGSIGISVLTASGESADTLQRQADLALYQAKADGKGRVQVYTPALDATVHAREQIRQELSQALERGELELHFQPQFSGQHLIGAEALLRWESAALGRVPPDQFIPVAEDTGLIFPIGSWVLEQACHQAAAWKASGTPLRVAVNISPRQFAHTDFVAQVEACLQRCRLPGHLLELELTERLVVHDLEGAATKISRLKQLGVQVALDDFGTGQSSLSYLMNLPIQTLKIDRQFVLNAEHSEAGQGVIRAITSIALALHIRVVAEGVETLPQHALVTSLGCEVVQGYLLGRPMTAGNFDVWLGSRLQPSRQTLSAGMEG